MNSSEQLNSACQLLGKAYCKKYPDIELIALATTDGFIISHLSNGIKPIEMDKLAAAVSTFFSVGDAVSRQILGKNFDLTFIETQAGNFVLTALHFQDKDFVLAISANINMNIANFRHVIKRFANDILENANRI